MNDIYKEVAFDIGADLCRNAIWNGPACNWIEYNYDFNVNSFNYKPLSFEFYDGTSGIAFFLLNLYQVTGEIIFKTTALGALEHAWNAKENGLTTTKGSFYLGTSGLAYVYLKAAQLFNEHSLSKRAEEILTELNDFDLANSGYEVLSGIAGTIPLMIWASKVLNNPLYIQTAQKWAEFLLSKANSGNEMLSWNFMNNNEIPLSDLLMVLPELAMRFHNFLILPAKKNSRMLV
ncbi:MAG: hypothetical protein IPP71_07815 [Bacteroidetes bacterium]|nr:hypothetical protein [Bacteroidota bacterium]